MGTLDSAPASGAHGVVCGLPRAAQVSLAVCLFYAASSVAISLLNKAVLSSYAFSCYFFMLAAQLAMTLTFCVATRDLMGNPFRVPHFDAAVYRASIPMSVAYIANVCLGLLGLQMVNVPMFFCIRRTAAAFILAYEFVAMGRVAEPTVRGAVGVIVAGALVAGGDSLRADLVGYAVTLANNLATAAASVMQRQFADATKAASAAAASSGGSGGGAGGGGGGPFGVMYFQALTALPACATLALLTGEMGTLAAFPHRADPSFWAAFIAASIMGLVLSYSSLLCTTHNSPLATSITGNAKDVVITIIGAIAFPGFKATATSVAGLILSFTGSGLYSYVNLRKALAAKPAGAAAGGSGAAAGGSEGGAAAVKAVPALAATPKGAAEGTDEESAPLVVPVTTESGDDGAAARLRR
jgi:hypothetical protein